MEDIFKLYENIENKYPDLKLDIFSLLRVCEISNDPKEIGELLQYIVKKWREELKKEFENE